MKRLSISLFLSVCLHIAAIAGIITMELLQKPVKKSIKIMFIKPVKLSELRTLKPEPAKPKPMEKKVVKPPPTKIAKQPVPSPTPTPHPVLTPVPAEKTPVPAPTKKPLKKSDTLAAKKEKEQKAKVVFLKKIPYFKNWPEDRIRRLQLPPGIKSWQEAKALTDYFDKQYNWTMTPPELENPKNRKLDHNPDVNPYVTPKPGETTTTAYVSPSPGETEVPGPTPTPEPSTVPNPDGTPIPWRLYKDKPEAKIYDVRFYKDKTGFIGTFDEDKKVVAVSYFPFDPQKAKKSPADPDETIEVAIPNNVKPQQVKHFNLILTPEDFQTDPDLDLKSKQQIVLDIIKQYDLLER